MIVLYHTWHKFPGIVRFVRFYSIYGIIIESRALARPPRQDIREDPGRNQLFTVSVHPGALNIGHCIRTG